MSGWDLFTWSAIVVLVAGSIAVFAWFLGAAGELLRNGRDEGDQR